MPRSSRQKSSKHGSRDARDYSNWERNLATIERKGREESNVKASMELSSGGKRKVLSGHDLEIENSELLKRRKDKGEGSANGRWEKSKDNRETLVLKKYYEEFKSKGNRKYDESLEEVKKKREKREEKKKVDRDYSRKESKERGPDQKREGSEGKNERIANNTVDAETVGPVLVMKKGVNKDDFNKEHVDGKKCEEKYGKVTYKVAEIVVVNELRKHEGTDYGRLASRDNTAKDKRVLERDKDKNGEGLDKKNRHIDGRTAKDHSNSKSREKSARGKQGNSEIGQEETVFQVTDLDGEYGRHHYGHNQDWDWEQEWSQDHDQNSRRYSKHNHDCHKTHFQDHGYVGQCDHGRLQDHDHDCDSSLFEHFSGHVGDTGAKRYLDVRGEYSETSAEAKVKYLNVGKKFFNDSKVMLELDRSRLHQANLEPPSSTSRRKRSPSSSLHGGADGYRHYKQEDVRFKDIILEQRSHVASDREVTRTSPAAERVSKHCSVEKSGRMEDKYRGEFSVERSPRSTDRYLNKSNDKGRFDSDGTGLRASGTNVARDNSASEGRLGRELLSDKLLVNGSYQADSSFQRRAGQSKSSASISSQPVFRTGIDGPSFLGQAEEDSRHNSGARYRRNFDPDVRRGDGNGWKGIPNWSSPFPNAFIHFQPGAPHGRFPPLMPQFLPPAMFGVRPSMEVNHQGMQYHIPDADRFPGHFRPFGWEDMDHMVDGSAPPQLPGWDGNCVVFKDEPLTCDGPEWDQSDHLVNRRGREEGGDTSKGHNADLMVDLPPTSWENDYPGQPPKDEASSGKALPKSRVKIDDYEVRTENVEIGSRSITQAINTSTTIGSSTNDTSPGLLKVPNFSGTVADCHLYLSMLGISSELALPELYEQCMSLIDVGQSQTIVEDITDHVKLEEGERSEQRILDASAPLFPDVEYNTFQRAMNLYKQSMDPTWMRVISEKLRLVLSTDQEKMKTHIPLLNSCNLETPPVGQEKSPLPATKPSHGCPEEEHVLIIPEPVPLTSMERSDETAPEVNSELADDDENEAKVGVSSNLQSINGGEKHRTFGDSFKYLDVSPKTCEGSRPRSNESELVISSRIHHSPESTH